MATGVAANGAARDPPSSSEAAALIQGAKPTGSALKIRPVRNRVPYRRRRRVDRRLVQMPGEVNGTAGRFEWIVDGGSLTRQVFVRGGTINGTPIKP